MDRSTFPQQRGLLARIAFLVSAMAVACSGGSGGGTSPSATVGLDLSVTTVSVPAGSSTNVVATIVREGGFTGAVTLTPAPPTGVSVESATLPESVTTTALRVQVDPDQTAGTQFQVPVVAAAGSGTATVLLTVAVEAVAPSAQSLIQAALDAGTIDYPTSLLYRAYAFYGDTRLPAELQGAGSVEEDLTLPIEVTQATLPDPVSGLIAPFLVRPTDSTSIFNQTGSLTAAQATLGRRALVTAAPCPTGSGATATQWRSQLSGVVSARVWVQCSSNPAYDDLLLGTALSLIEGVWRAETAYMGAQPVPDLGGDNYGGDSAIDFYLVNLLQLAPRAGRLESIPSTAGAVAPPDPPFSGSKSSAHVLLNASYLFSGFLKDNISHEFFHVLQYAFNQAIFYSNHNEFWYVEASAAWAETKFAPEWSMQWVHRYFPFFQKTKDPLHKSVPSSVATDPTNYALYRSYIWPFYAENVLGGGMVKQSWYALAGSGATSAVQANQALDSVFDFKTNFREFAFRNLNDDYPGALDKTKRWVSYAYNNQFPDGLGPPVADQELLDPATRYVATVALSPLHAAYYSFPVAPDPSNPIHKVKVDISNIFPDGAFDVESVARPKNSTDYKRENRAGQKTFSYCLDKPEENIVELRLVVSNHQLDLSAQLTGEIDVDTGGGCDSWSGNVTAEATGAYKMTAQVTYDIDLTAPPGVLRYKPTGTVSYSVPDGADGCHTTVSPGSQNVVPADGLLSIDQSTTPATFNLGGGTVWSATYTKTCPDGSSGSVTASAGGTWLQAQGQLQPDGTIKGTNTIGGVETYTYSFTQSVP